MAKLIVEIGAATKSFRTEVEGLPPVVSGSFRKMKQEADNNDLGSNIKGVKKSFNDLKDVVAAGGIATAVTQFFSLAIDQANKSKDANDLNAAAVRGFGAAIAAGKETFANFAVFTVGSLNRLGESIGDRVKDVGHFFGLFKEGSVDLEESERATRAVVAASEDAKKHAAEWNQLNNESKQIAQQLAALQRGQIPLLEQQAQLEAKRNDLLAEAAAQAGNHLAARKLQNEAAQVGLELAKLGKAIDDEAAKTATARRAEAEKLNETYLAGLEPIKRQKELKDQIATLEAVLKNATLSTTEAEVYRTQIASRQNELKKTEGELLKQHQDFLQKSALDQEDYLRLLTLEQKQRTGLTESESAELDVLRAQSEQKRAHTELLDLAGKKIIGTITPAEEARLGVLLQQDQKLKDQLTAKEALKKATGEQIAAEKTWAEMLDAEVETLRQQYNWTGATINLKRTGTPYASQSTTALEGQRDRLLKQETQVKLTNQDEFSKNIALSFVDLELKAVEKELSSRYKVTSYIEQYGKDAAISQYGDAAVNQVMQDLQKSTTENNATLTAMQLSLQEITDRLAGRRTD